MPPCSSRRESLTSSSFHLRPGDGIGTAYPITFMMEAPSWRLHVAPYQAVPIPSPANWEQHGRNRGLSTTMGCAYSGHNQCVGTKDGHPFVVVLVPLCFSPFRTNVLGLGPEFLGRVRLVTSLASLAGVGLFNFVLRKQPLRRVFFWSNIVGTALGASPVSKGLSFRIPRHSSLYQKPAPSFRKSSLQVAQSALLRHL